MLTTKVVQAAFREEADLELRPPPPPKINKVLLRWVGGASLIACKKTWRQREAFAKLDQNFHYFYCRCLHSDDIRQKKKVNSLFFTSKHLKWKCIFYNYKLEPRHINFLRIGIHNLHLHSTTLVIVWGEKKKKKSQVNYFPPPPIRKKIGTYDLIKRSC